MKILYFLLITTIISACANVPVTNLDKIYGPSQVHNRAVNIAHSPAENHVDYWSDVKPILDKRCVACHGCYDAPCQLKLTAIEGLDRGATKTKIYDPVKLEQGNLTRLFEDAFDTQSWREKDFYPVLNEHENTLEANRKASPLYQLLKLKEAHPLPLQKLLSEEDFNLGVEREQVCPKPNEMDYFTAEHPLWGMPYALPGLPQNEQKILKTWVEQGSRYSKRAAISQELQNEIDEWEAFLNKPSLKSQLSSRYIYEHLFIAHIYFEEKSQDTFFKLVRSSTPPGQAVKQIATRRPYNEPNVERVYYRIIPEKETIIKKTHMPYALNEQRKILWQDLFLNDNYDVTSLPSYDKHIASNPFSSFEQIPVQSRYKFLLSEANFTIMNFIKGPVCRGQSAVNVIRDHFWIFFINPDANIINNQMASNFIKTNIDNLSLSNTSSNDYLPIGTWFKHSKNQRSFLESKNDFIADAIANKNTLNIDLLWDGDGENENAALTVFRNFDSATVEKGLIGNPPETAWVLSYSLLERIHYLLVAGYDVYGNVGHQLLSRMHMDFLRIEGEGNFLYLLPESTKSVERLRWYRGSGKQCLEYISTASSDSRIKTSIDYQTKDPKLELYELAIKHLGSSLAVNHSLAQIKNKNIQENFYKLQEFSGEKTMLLSEMSLIKLNDVNNDSKLFTLLRNSAHSNVTSIFNENKNLIPKENTVTVTNGVVGSYPNTIFEVNVDDIDLFVTTILALNNQQDYESLLDQFGIRRTDPNFWKVSDEIHELLQSNDVIDYGRLDYNRLENR